MTLKIMHTGDVHLGMKFSQYPAISQQLEEARYQTLKNLIKIANQKRANLLVVAGDLFDKINIAEEKIIKTIKILDQFAGDAILILPGNHDYQDGTNQLWSIFRENLKGRILLLDEEKIYQLTDFGIDAAVYPAPCDSRLSANNKLSWIKNLDEKPDNKYQIGIAHGALAGFSPDLTDSYFKMNKTELLDLNMDLWLLGHSHLPYPEQKQVRGQRLFNNSTPEPDGMDCSHPGYAWFIELEAQNIKAERLITGKFHFADLEYQINLETDFEKMTAEILNDQPETKILRLKLKGNLPKETFLIKDEFLNQLRDNCFYLKIDQSNLKIKIDREIIAEEFAVNSFPYELLTELENEEQALHLAYKILKEVQD